VIGLRFRTALAVSVVVLMLEVALAEPSAAHPLGNFSVNQYSRIEVGTEQIEIAYVLDLAELPTVADRPLLDANSDGTADAAERERYLDARLNEIVPALSLTSGGAELPLQVTDRSLALHAGQAGLETTRIEASLRAALPVGGSAADKITYRNDYAIDRLGWREIVVVNGAEIGIAEGELLAADRTDGLRAYPDDLLSSPLDERVATFAWSAAPGAPAFDGTPVASDAGVMGIGDRLEAIVNGGTLSTSGVLLALLAAAGWGALHALSPGHGKTVVGAYLVGSRGTPRHALFLGLTVTITHTAGVIALGLVILLASKTILPEQLYPWLSLISGLLVAALGVTILRQRVLGLPAFGHHHHHEHEHDHSHHHDHDHDQDHVHAHGIAHTHDGHTHSHLPPGAEGDRVTWRSLLALGVSGGLLPCPSALLALLGAVAVGRAGFGLLVVIAFSLGLAATLSGVGLLFLYAGRFLERRSISGRWAGLLRYAPAAAALAVTSSGVLIVVRAVAELR
jgi:nickel/cobalt exporter